MRSQKIKLPFSPLALTPLLTNGAHSDQWVLPRADVLVIGPVSIHVGGAVDQPGDVEWDGIAEDGRQEVGVPQALSPDAPGHQRGNHKAHEHHADLIVPRRQDGMLSLGTCWWQWGQAEQATGKVRNCDNLDSFCIRDILLCITLCSKLQTYISTRARQATQIWE